MEWPEWKQKTANKKEIANYNLLAVLWLHCGNQLVNSFGLFIHYTFDMQTNHV